MKLNEDSTNDNTNKLRLRTPKGDIVFVAAENVLLAKSFDHWVKVLVKDGKEYAWFESHSTLHDFLLLSAAAHLARSNKFYGINKARVTMHSSNRRNIVFDNVFTVELEHSFPPYFF